MLLPWLVACTRAPEAPRPEVSPEAARIAFGSCAKQAEPQPIWTAILGADPDAFLFLGDNVYGDTRDMALLQQAYDTLAAQPGFVSLRASGIPIFATWDDHDFGENDADSSYPQALASEQIFEAFWGGEERLGRRGVYEEREVQHDGHTIQILLLDLRTFRSPMKRGTLTKGMELRGIGPYLPSEGTMLGEEQWAWLERALQSPADLRILASSLPVIAQDTGWEIWANFPAERDRLLALLQASPAVIVSGDTHWGEISRLGVPGPVDITSSGLNISWSSAPPQRHREGAIVGEPNFGLLHVDWKRGEVTAELRTVAGEVARSVTVPISRSSNTKQ